MKHIFLTLICSSCLLMSCGIDDDGSPSTSTNQENIFQNGSANYLLNLDLNFTEENNPVDYPDNPTIGTIVVITHSAEITVFERDQLASDGLMAYAEDGDVNGLAAFLSNEVGDDDDEIGFSIATISAVAPDSNTDINVALTPTRSRISFLARINPSPDWFLGVSSINVVNDDMLIEEASFDLWVLDAGTAGGNTYESPEEMEDENVTEYIGLPFGNGPLDTILGELNLTRDN